MIKDKKRIIFKNNIEHLRREAGITVEELANRAGISRTYAQEVKAGIKAPSHITQEKIAKALNTNVSALTSKKNQEYVVPLNKTIYSECGKFIKDAASHYKVDLDMDNYLDRTGKLYNLVACLAEKDNDEIHPTMELAFAVLMQQ